MTKVVREEVVVSDLQKKTAQSVVNIFETGRALGDYGKVTLLAGASRVFPYPSQDES
jgi:chitosanase